METNKPYDYDIIISCVGAILPDSTNRKQEERQLNFLCIKRLFEEIFVGTYKTSKVIVISSLSVLFRWNWRFLGNSSFYPESKAELEEFSIRFFKDFPQIKLFIVCPWFFDTALMNEIQKPVLADTPRFVAGMIVKICIEENFLAKMLVKIMVWNKHFVYPTPYSLIFYLAITYLGQTICRIIDWILTSLFAKK